MVGRLGYTPFCWLPMSCGGNSQSKTWIQANLRIPEEKGLFPTFSGFPRSSLGPPERAKKGRKRAKKADFQVGSDTP